MKKHGLGQPYWNAHQIYTWVYTRNPRLVVLLSDSDEGDSVEPGITEFYAMSSRPGAEFSDYAEAQVAIVLTLQEGRLPSFGRREGTGTLEEIPALEWIDLHFVWLVFHGSAEAVGMTENPPSSIVGAPRWYGLRFKRDDVLELWPPTEIETGAKETDDIPRPELLKGEPKPPCPKKPTIKPRGPTGRKPGSGSYAAKDCVLWKKMKAALNRGDAKSIWEAAGQFAKEAPGTTVVENKRSRLARGYGNWISSQ